jgi:hypothetical protein
MTLVINPGPGSGGQNVRALTKGGAETQVVTLDLGGAGAEALVSGSIPVTGTFFQATQPVSIASMPSTPVTGTFWQATQPVSFTWVGLTDTQLRASAVPVSLTSTEISNFPATQAVTGTFWQATQPVSAASLPLPSGAATETTLAALNTKFPAQTNGGVPVHPVSPFFWRVGFSEVGSGLQGSAADELVPLKTGAGMAVSQSGGNLVVTTGTTANAETVFRSVDTFRGAMLARYQLILSQRIANQTFRVELADLIGEGLSYTINSATSVTVTFPATTPFTAANVGQSLRLAVLSSVGIPGRYAIASVSGLTVTFTVASWPASGSGTLTLYGFNWMAAEYSGTTATNALIDAQRRGWASGNTTATINTTASPGHVGQIAFDVMSMSYADALAATNTGYQWTQRASRITNIPDEDVSLYLFVVIQNGNTAPASTTTATIGFLSVEDQPRNKVRVSGADPAGGGNATPVQLMGGTTTVTGTVTANIGTGSLAAGTNLVGDVGMQVRANATGAMTGHHIVAAGSTNVAQIKATAGRVYGWCLSNTTASWRYVKLHNVASASAGAAVAQTIGIPPNDKAVCSFPLGIAFATAISRSIVTGSADADATAVTAGDVVGDIFFA